jgi:hypothetical protein
MLALACGEIRGADLYSQDRAATPRASVEPGFVGHRARSLLTKGVVGRHDRANGSRAGNEDVGLGFHPIEGLETRRSVHGRGAPGPPRVTHRWSLTAFLRIPNKAARQSKRCCNDGMAACMERFGPASPSPPGAGPRRSHRPGGSCGGIPPGSNADVNLPSPQVPLAEPPCPLDHACRPPPGVGGRAPSGSDTAKSV